MRSARSTKPRLSSAAGSAAYEQAGSTLATVVPPDWRLIQLIETGRTAKLDAVTVSFAALLHEV
jgi:hypothetical protein